MFECGLCTHINGLSESCYCRDCGIKVCQDCADNRAMVCPSCNRAVLDVVGDVPKSKKKTLNRKKLSNVRVIQRNLVYVTNISLNLAKGELLKTDEYFGKFGKIKKIVVNRNNVYSGPQGRSVSAYVTYYREQDAAAAIATVDKMVIDSRVLRASFGTTKYCSYFLRNVRCPNPECMYLHDLGAEDDSFTKEDMSQGKHLIISAQRVSKYHPDFMDSRDFTEMQRSPSPTMLSSSLTRSMEIPRSKTKKHVRSRSDSSLMDGDYYQDWQERDIKDSNADFVTRKSHSRLAKSVDDLATSSSHSWLKLLFQDSVAVPPSNALNDYKDIWTVDLDTPLQSRFAFARNEELEDTKFLANSAEFTPPPGNWASGSPLKKGKGNWNYNSREQNGTYDSLNQWSQPPQYPTTYQDTPPGL